MCFSGQLRLRCHIPTFSKRAWSSSLAELSLSDSCQHANPSASVPAADSPLSNAYACVLRSFRRFARTHLLRLLPPPVQGSHVWEPPPSTLSGLKYCTQKRTGARLLIPPSSPLDLDMFRVIRALGTRELCLFCLYQSFRDCLSY